jgi:hypothetical protein
MLLKVGLAHERENAVLSVRWALAHPTKCVLKVTIGPDKAPWGKQSRPDASESSTWMKHSTRGSLRVLA